MSATDAVSGWDAEEEKLRELVDPFDPLALDKSDELDVLKARRPSSMSAVA